MTGASMLTLSIPVTPVAQPRARACVRYQRRNGIRRPVASVYDPGTADQWKSLISRMARRRWHHPKITGAVYLRVSFRFARPKSHYRSGDPSRGLARSAPVNHTKKPDLDNLVKAVKDAITDAGIWADDSHVISEKVTKRWVPIDAEPGATIVVMAISPDGGSLFE